MTTASSPSKMGPFNLGMNNRLPDTALEVPKVGTFLRSAVNVDITVPGTIKRRGGFAQSLAGTDVHSLWSDEDQAYMVDGTVLYHLTGAPGALGKSIVMSGLKPGVPVSFTRAAKDVVCSDGDTLYKLNGSAYATLSVPMMDSEPLVSTTSGSLTQGTYQVCFAYIADDYRISGTTQPVSVEVGEGGGIFITNLPASLPLGVAYVAIYMTEPNGDELFMAAATSAPTFGITTPPALSGRCQTLNLLPMPGGLIVRHGSGRFFVAKGNMLLYSEPFSTLYDPGKNFIQFPTAVVVLECLGAGIYVCTETASYHFNGDITNTAMNQVLPYGAVPGTSGVYPDKSGAYWMSTRGLVQGDESGQVKNVQESSVVVGVAKAGATMFREQDGFKQVVASLFGSETTAAAAHSFMEADVIRKGTVL